MTRLVLATLAALVLEGAPVPSPPHARETPSIAGVVRPVRWVRVSAEVEGRIVRRSAREHARVEGGAEVIRLDDTLRSADLKTAEAQLLEAGARHKLAKLDLDREAKLEARDVSSRAAFDRAEALERSAWAAVMMAEADLDRARFLLERTRVTTPLTGIIARLDVEPDEYVIPGTFLFSVMDVDEVKIESFVESDVARALVPGQEVLVRDGDREHRAVVRSVAPGTDNESRTFKVVLTASNPPAADVDRPRLLPGTTVSWRREEKE